MALTKQRAEELVAEYKELKKRVEAINRKYSLTVYEVDLGFPETLGLQKLTFTPKTDEEIAALVALEVQQKCAAKQASIEKTFSDARASLVQQQLSADESHRQKLAQLSAEYAKNCDDYKHKAVNANLQYSTIFQNALAAILESHNAEVGEQTTRYEAQNAAFTEKENAIKATYEQQTALLNEQREVIADAADKRIRAEQEKEAVTVQKYNNNVDEKEQKYQFSCIRATEYAREAEYNRALAAARIYSQLGSTGYEQRKKTEKYYLIWNKFGEYTKEEALFIMSLDSFLRTELEEYYTTLENNVNEYLV